MRGDREFDRPLSSEEEARASRLSRSDLQRIDECLLSHVTPNLRKVAKVIARTMGDLGDDFPGLPDVFYATRIKHLAANGAIEASGNLNRMRYSEIRMRGPDSTPVNVPAIRDPFIDDVEDDDTAAVRKRLAAGRDPNIPDQHGWKALHRAAANDSARAGKMLIKAGSSLSATGTDQWTPLHLAAVSGSSRMVKLLVEAGADVDAVSNFGDTPLHLCVISQNLVSARYLLEAGADPNRKNVGGKSPLEKAESEGCVRLAVLMRSWLRG